MDVETVRWMTVVLNKTMDVKLNLEISSLIEEVDKHRRGAIVMFCLIVWRIFERNQEAKSAMINYLTKLNLRNTNGQHVPMAALRIRTICRALGPGVPLNVICCVLDGMKHASNKSFKCIYKTTSALLSLTLYQSIVDPILPQKCLFGILQDLETKYLELVESKDWEVIGHEASAFKLFRRFTRRQISCCNHRE